MGGWIGFANVPQPLKSRCCLLQQQDQECIGIDACIGSIERQIRKNKTRLAKRLRQDAFVREPEQVSSFVPDEPEESEFRIVRTKRFSIKPMTREEAILQMNLLDHSFFAFRDEEADGAFAVVYRRNDGGYGLLEDENE